MDPYLGEIRLFSLPFAPKGWALCNGQILSIQQNAALFSLLGTYYGGNGMQTFALPDLRGRVPLGYGNTLVMGLAGGVEKQTLALAELPAHKHQLAGTNDFANANVPGNALLAAQVRGGVRRYASSADTALHSSSVSAVGNGQGHNNLQPSLVMTFAIALTGIYPNRS